MAAVFAQCAATYRVHATAPVATVTHRGRRTGGHDVGPELASRWHRLTDHKAGWVFVHMDAGDRLSGQEGDPHRQTSDRCCRCRIRGVIETLMTCRTVCVIRTMTMLSL